MFSLNRQDMKQRQISYQSGRRGFKIEFVPVQTIYAKKKLYDTLATTVNFIKVLFRNYE